MKRDPQSYNGLATCATTRIRAPSWSFSHQKRTVFNVVLLMRFMAVVG